MKTVSKNMASEELDDLITSLPGNVCWKDLQGRYVKCNKTFSELFHYETPKAMIGVTDYDFLSAEHADAVTKNDQWVTSNNQTKDFFEKITDDDGNEVIYCSKKAPRHDKDGNVIGLTCIAFDMTETMQQMDTLRIEGGTKTEFINNMAYLDRFAKWFPGTVFWKNLDGVYLGCNDIQREFFSYTAPSIVGLTLFDFLPQELAQAIHDTDKEVMDSGEGKLVEEAILNSDGSDSIWMSSKVPLTDELGNVIGLLGIAIDITERIKLEKKLIDALHVAETTSQAKTQFIMNMSHDLRTPFVGILGFTDVLMQTEQSEENLEMLQHISDASKRLLNIISELIDLVSLSTPTNVSNDRVNLPSLINDIKEVMYPPIKTKGLDFQVYIDKKVPKTVYINKYAINRLLLNLVGNATKFTNKGYVKIDCTLNGKTKEGLKILELVVEDSGIGIPDGDHERIFDKFIRAALARERFEGTGLGLYFVKLLVTELGGTIVADTEKRDGARFICKIPFKTKGT